MRDVHWFHKDWGFRVQKYIFVQGFFLRFLLLRNLSTVVIWLWFLWLIPNFQVKLHRLTQVSHDDWGRERNAQNCLHWDHVATQCKANEFFWCFPGDYSWSSGCAETPKAAPVKHTPLDQNLFRQHSSLQIVEMLKFKGEFTVCGKAVQPKV